MDGEIDEAQEPQPVYEKSPPEWRKLRNFALFVAFVAILSVINHQIALPYYVLGPGGANTVKDYVQIDPTHSQGQKGKLLLATVSVAQATPFDWVLAHVMPADEIISQKKLFGPKTTQSQYAQQNQEAMDDSQLTAITVAMKRAGYDVSLLGDGGLVAAVDSSAPAGGKLNVNDVITAIDGKTVATADELVGLVRSHKVGDTVHFDVTDIKKQKRTVDITLAARPQNGAPYMGVALSTANPHLKTPFNVSFKRTNIGGPSAGLAFTLTLLDELTPGELTGGQTVATTGTIGPDGRVGPVGGVKQKTHAVEAAGAKIFIVPTDEYADAKKEASKNLTVIPVDTLDQAISALTTHGGDGSGIPPAKPAV